ncbi:MAG: hypothetical protein J7L45_00075 [Candidatus Aenigmarchaeota archaeon]|nr:hypothetical protein [Candidatus Aenigmarchaeota archaeon]
MCDGPFYKKEYEDLIELDVEFLPNSWVIKDYIERRFKKKPASVMYFCRKHFVEVMNYYRNHQSGSGEI